jgi:hypothetical protein
VRSNHAAGAAESRRMIMKNKQIGCPMASAAHSKLPALKQKA